MSCILKMEKWKSLKKDGKRKVLAAVLLVIFLLTFTPVPLAIY